MKKILITSTIALALVATVTAAFGLVGRAYAQAPTPTATAEAQTTTPPEGWDGSKGGRHGGPGGKMDGGQLREYMLAAEAEAFGLTSEELQALRDEGKSLTDLAIEQDLTVAEFEAKMDAAHQSALAQAVTDGVITQEQADAFAAREAAGRPAHADDADNPLYEYMQAATAEAFGITVEELQALETDGKTLKDLAIEQNLTVADFQAKRDSARQAALDNAVADGVITQEQADAMKEHQEMGRGGMGGGRHGGGRHGGQPGDGQCPPSTTD
jgi:competence protein ComGC